MTDGGLKCMPEEQELREDTSPARADGPAWAVLGAASPEKADAFLEKQGRLADLQAKELAHELSLRHWSLRVRHVSDVLKLGFELAVAFIVLALAVGIGAVLWQASHAEGLVIRSFDVPQTFAAKGLTGQVVANKLLDRLTLMQSETDSTRAASSFANDWTNDIKVEIPDTGISLGEAVRFLNGWLGHETYLSGELYQTESGIALTVRMDNNPGVTFEGKPGELANVVDHAAETVFAHAQPYRYQVYLGNRHRYAESEAAGLALAAAGPRNEAAWAHMGLGTGAFYAGAIDAARRYFDAARMENPVLPNADASQGITDRILSREQDALDHFRRAVVLLHGAGAREWNPAAIGPILISYDGFEAGLQGDLAKARAETLKTAGSGGASTVAFRNVFLALSMHDLAAARGVLAELDRLPAGPETPPFAAMARGQFLVATEDWRGAASQFESAMKTLQAIERTTKGWRKEDVWTRANVWPYEARAYAMLGNAAAADAILKVMPADCDLCARTHGQIEAMRNNPSAATVWFRLVSDRSPDIPFADTEWGRMLLQKGDYDGAIAHFAVAHQRGPHFADPLEMWGEALMQENRSDLAIAKFEEANKYAPDWGRLHLEWGKALFYAGKKDEAKKQFATASGLDLSAVDRVQLPKMTREAK